MGWEEQLWNELEAASPEQRIIMAGEVITRMSQNLLPLLGRERRLLAVALIQGGEFTYTSLAETIGARTGTVQRLVEEGRRLRKEELASSPLPG